jgi:WD40 repeat protein
LTAANDGTARIWDAERGELRTEFLDRSTWLTEAAVDPEGRMLVTGGGDGILRFWDLASGRKVWSLRAHRKTIVAMHFDGSDLLTRSREGELARWRLPQLQSSQELMRGIDRVLRCLPVRFDETSGGLAEQAQDCEFR